MPDSVAPSLYAKCGKPSGLGFNFMKNIDNLIGKKYGNWTVLSFVKVGVNYQKIVKVECGCGVVKDVYLNTLKQGSSKSCGCLVKRATKHGLLRHPIYNVWRGMKERCLNPNFKQYHDYGGRGIKIYEYWVKDFMSFFHWALKNGYKKGLQLDRKDNDKDYCPSNCRFITHKQNNRNKRDNRYIDFNGKKRLFIELCEEYGLNYKTVYNRLKRGWSVEDTFNKPIQKNQYA